MCFRIYDIGRSFQKPKSYNNKIGQKKLHAKLKRVSAELADFYDFIYDDISYHFISFQKECYSKKYHSPIISKPVFNTLL